MATLTDGLEPARNGTEERLDRVLKGMELLLVRQGLLPDSAPAAAEEEPPAERVVKLREPRGSKER